MKLKIKLFIISFLTLCLSQTHHASATSFPKNLNCTLGDSVYDFKHYLNSELNSNGRVDLLWTVEDADGMIRLILKNSKRNRIGAMVYEGDFELPKESVGLDTALQISTRVFKIIYWPASKRIRFQIATKGDNTYLSVSTGFCE